jgi:malate dehydrogenase (oxaloacetate-decarboxylating)(NADP+)
MSFGISSEEAHSAFYLVDSKGLVTDNRGDKLASHKLPFSRKDFQTQHQDLLEVVKVVQPTVLIGLSGQGGAFTEEIIKEFAKHSEKPIIFALSNPIDNSETNAENAYTWTEGRCIFASGSPFQPVELNGKKYLPGQGNNMYIFPGLSLGSVVPKSKHVSDKMILVAAKTLASCVTDEEFSAGKIYPDLNNFRTISKKIVEVAKQPVTRKNYQNSLKIQTLIK